MVKKLVFWGRNTIPLFEDEYGIPGAEIFTSTSDLPTITVRIVGGEGFVETTAHHKGAVVEFETEHGFDGEDEYFISEWRIKPVSEGFFEIFGNKIKWFDFVGANRFKAVDFEGYIAQIDGESAIEIAESEEDIVEKIQECVQELRQLEEEMSNTLRRYGWSEDNISKHKLYVMTSTFTDPEDIEDPQIGDVPEISDEIRNVRYELIQLKDKKSKGH